MFQVNEKFYEYALKESLKEIRDDLQDKASREELELMSAQNDSIKENVGKFITAKEVTGRIDIIYENIGKKLEIRPTMDVFNERIGKYDNKIQECVINN